MGRIVMNNLFKRILASAAAAVMLILPTGCGNGNDAEKTSAEAEPTAVSAENEIKKVTISCAGDVTLGTDVNFGGYTMPELMADKNNDYSYLFSNVKEIFENDDLTIVNFEGTLTDRGVRQDKTFAFKADPEYVQALSAGSIEAVTLANNHSSDYGEESAEDTKKYLEDAGIIWFENENAAVTEVNGVKVGLVGIYELDGSAAETLPIAMQDVKDKGAELIIVEAHWGVEGENTPTQSQIDLAHEAVDLGADLVIGHHPHVLQGVEKYNKKYIVYSMGNFCFGGNQNPSDKDTMIFRQTFSVRDGMVGTDDDYEIIPCSISSTSSYNDYCPTPLEGDAAARVAEKIQSFSDRIGDGNLKLKFRGVDIEGDADA